ncbi:MAG: site-2 protease family protein [Candidatus Paceibacterota bacterium]
MNQIIFGIFVYIVIVLSATFHEYAHGLMAFQLGDDTAKRMGRLTLNPIAHLDIFGTVIVPILFTLTAGSFIGWAKPVPYNPLNLSDKRFGSLKVALAGPSANIAIAIILGLLIRFSGGMLMQGVVLELISFITYVNIFLALFNLIPIPPLDGSKILFDLIPSSERILNQVGFVGVFIALVISFYVLSPIAQFVFSIITGMGSF